MNEKMIHDMMHCNGQKMNCDTCSFREHPECRNAMARHAAALIQLQDVVIDNQGRTAQSLMGKRDSAENLAKLNGKVLGELGEILDGLGADLAKQRHCPTCEHCAPEEEDEQPEICQICMTPGDDSCWELAKRYLPEEKRKQAEMTGDGDGDEAEDAENDGPVVVSAEQA